MTLKKKKNQTFSRVLIQLLARWQFCNTTQVPCLTPSSMRFTAIGPWPWPSDNENNLFVPKPWSSANFNSIAVGSAPGVRTKIRGIQQNESAYDEARSNGGGSIYCLPNSTVRKQRNTIRFDRFFFVYLTLKNTFHEQLNRRYNFVGPEAA